MLRPLAFALAASLGLAACETQLPPDDFAEITFRYAPPIALSARDVTVVPAYRAPVEAPYINHELPVDPVATAARWGRERLNPVGGPAAITVTVVEMSVTETPLETEGGLRGAFTEDQAERYDMRVVMRVDAVDAATGITSQTEVSALRARTVPEGITLADREAVWHEMLEQLMRDMDRRLSDAVRRELAVYVVN